jgi:hypothetical protein
MSSFEKFAADLSSWYWWVSVVAIGLAVNLASSYLKPTLDRLYERWSTTRQVARLAADKIYQVDVRILASDSRLLICRGFEEMRFRVFTLALFLLSFSNVLGAIYIKKSAAIPDAYGSIVVVVLFVFSLFTMAMALWAHKYAMYLAQTIRGAKRQVIDELYPSNTKQPAAGGDSQETPRK